MNLRTTAQLTIAWEVKGPMDRPHNPYIENAEGWEYSVPPSPLQVRNDLFLKLAKERKEGDARRAAIREERRQRRRASR